MIVPHQILIVKSYCVNLYRKCPAAVAAPLALKDVGEDIVDGRVVDEIRTIPAANSSAIVPRI